VRLPLRVRAPASTANLGPGFDCAGAALDLWNELEIAEDGDARADLGHLGVRAFARLADPSGLRFSFTDRVPRASGLGSSASVIALGLVAGAVVTGRELDPESLLAEGIELEGHGDNLAAALAGGVCLTWSTRIVRIADRPPAEIIAVVPRAHRVETTNARAALPERVPHADAAFTAARAAMLGAALASGSAELFAEALADRLHEPYRAATAPLLAAVRERLPTGALGATLSGSGPAVVVWTRPEAATDCGAELAAAFPNERVLRLNVSPHGAGPL
jgi:homoserine kinase